MRRQRKNLLIVLMDTEGADVARWLNSKGVTGIVLNWIERFAGWLDVQGLLKK